MPFHPTPVSERVSLIYANRGALERDGHTVVLSQESGKTIIPIGVTAVLMIGPGVSVSHAAVALCAKEGALILWVGENGVRVYAAGDPRGRSEAVVRQAVLHADPAQRLHIARKVFKGMFGEDAPKGRSIEQLRGIEGAKVKRWYETTAQEYGISWSGRTHSMLGTVKAM